MEGSMTPLLAAEHMVCILNSSSSLVFELWKILNTVYHLLFYNEISSDYEIITCERRISFFQTNKQNNFLKKKSQTSEYTCNRWRKPQMMKVTLMSGTNQCQQQLPPRKAILLIYELSPNSFWKVVCLMPTRYRLIAKRKRWKLLCSPVISSQISN